MKQKILVAITLIFLFSPIFSMSKDGGNVPVVSKKGEVIVPSQDKQRELSESKQNEKSDQTKAIEQSNKKKMEA